MQPQGFPYRWEMPHQTHFPVTVTKRKKEEREDALYLYPIKKVKIQVCKVSWTLILCHEPIILMLKKQYDEITTESSLVWLESVDGPH